MSVFSFQCPQKVKQVIEHSVEGEGESYGHALEKAGVPVTIERFDGLIHGVYWMSGAVPRSAELQETIATFVGKYLS